MTQSSTVSSTVLGPSATIAPRSFSLARLGTLWPETARLIAMQAGPILACASIGFAGATILANLVSLVVSLSVTESLSSFFTAYPRIFLLELALEGGLGLFALLAARAMIVWLALHADPRMPYKGKVWEGCGAALRAVWQRLPALLISTLVYGLVICIGLAGVTLLLREWRVDVSSFVRLDDEVDYAAHTMLSKTISALVPDPGAPFSQLIVYGRFLLYRNDITRLARSAFFFIGDDPKLPLYLAGVAGCTAILVGETLLRLRTVSIMAARPNHALAGMRRSVRIGLEHFGFVTSSAWLLRLAMLFITVLFILLPSILAQTWLVPRLARQVSDVWPYPISTFLFACAGALVSVVLGAFEVVYDTRIYAALVDS